MKIPVAVKPTVVLFATVVAVGVTWIVAKVAAVTVKFVSP